VKALGLKLLMCAGVVLELYVKLMPSLSVGIVPPLDDLNPVLLYMVLFNM